MFASQSISPIRQVLTRLLPGFLLASLTLLTSCSSGTSSKSIATTSVAPSIITQPVSQTIPINRSAVFTVSATGAAPLQYQWYRNGAAIGGANAATYATPALTQADNNATFSVTVANTAGSVTSTTVTLYTGPRAPDLGDLRYLQLEQASPYDGPMLMNQGSLINLASFVQLGVGLGDTLSLGNIVAQGPGGPLCLWTSYLFQQGDLNNYETNFISGDLTGTTYSAYLQSLSNYYTVIYSLDYRPQCQQIGVAYTQEIPTQSFDQRMETSTPANLAAQVAADGASSRIVSAITFDSTAGKFVLLSYGWQGDTTTAYESKTIVDTSTRVIADAELLANQGYFISAFGGNNTSGYALVGMRVMGDTMPRPYSVSSVTNGTTTTTQGNQPPIPETLWNEAVVSLQLPSGSVPQSAMFFEQ